MKRRTRTYYSAAQRSMMWDLYQKGESLASIASHFDRSHTIAASIIGRTGGIRPADRKRRDCHLTLEEREEISRGIAADLSVRLIAQNLNRAPSTVSREISRNGGRVEYRASVADTQAWENAKRQKA